MAKRKPQFDIGNEEEDEILPSVGIINTPEEIAQRKILKIKGPAQINSAVNLKITAPKPIFTQECTEDIEILKKGLQCGSAGFLDIVPQENETTYPSIIGQLIAAQKIDEGPCIIRSNSIKSEKEKMFKNSSSTLSQIKMMNEQTGGLISPTNFFQTSSAKKVKQDPLPVIKENEPYKLIDKSIKSVKVNDIQLEYPQLNLQIHKDPNDNHSLSILSIDKPLYQGTIINNKYKKENTNTIVLETKEQEKEKFDILHLEFQLEQDYENFHI